MFTPNNRIHWTRIALVCLMLPVMAGFAQAQSSLIEDFTTSTYDDPVTMAADWNTDDGELKMYPFTPKEIGTVGGFSDPLELAVAGGYAYVADASAGLRVVDISNPGLPVIVATVNTPGISYKVQIEGDYAYLADATAGLQVINISDPTSPQLIATFDTPNTTRGLHIVGDIAYVADSSALLIIDISNPASPGLLGTMPVTGDARDVRVSGNTAVVAAYNGGVQVFDVADPTTPFPLTTIALTYVYGVDLAGDHAYVVGLYSGLHAIDISNPATAFEAGAIDTPGTAQKVKVVGNRAYVGTGYTGMRIYDITDPTAPLADDIYDPAGLDAFGVAISGQYAFVADRSDFLHAVSIADAVTPAEAGQFNGSGALYCTIVSGDIAYLAHGVDGLQILDVSDPTAPAWLGEYNPTYSINEVAASRRYAYLGTPSGIDVVDISDRTNPWLVSSYAMTSNPRDIHLVGNILYVAAGTAGFFALDTGNPASLAEIGSLNLSGSVYAAHIDGDIAYVAASTQGLVLLNISDPGNIGYLGQYNTTGNAFDVEVSGDMAYVADGDSGLLVFDVTDPYNPVPTTNSATAGSLRNLKVAGNRIFAATSYDGLSVFIISSPSFVAQVAHYDLSFADNIFVDGMYAYLSANTESLKVLQVFQHDWDLNRRTGRSGVYPVLTEVPFRARVIPTQLGNVTWEFSSSANTTIPFPVDGSWLKVEFGGTDLSWRSTHRWSYGVNSAVSQVEIQWLYEAAHIESVLDIAGDQGRQVRVEWSRSGNEFEDATSPITEYAVYRRIDGVAKGSTANAGDIDLTQYSAAVQQDAVQKLAAGWDFLTAVPVRGEDSYAYVAPTLADSTVVGGQAHTTFMVSSLTAVGNVFYDSPPDSGYSVDNLAPGVPAAIVANYGSGSVTLDWDDSVAMDFQYHRIYRGTEPDFVPALANLVKETANSNWVDNTPGSGTSYYKITALDFAGNESAPGAPEIASGVPGLGTGFVLKNAVPNPFNPQTTISYSLAKPGPVELAIFDLAGRKVRTLVDQTEIAGGHTVVWNGQDNRGKTVASGVYFYQLRSGQNVARKRIVMIK